MKDDFYKACFLIVIALLITLVVLSSVGIKSDYGRYTPVSRDGRIRILDKETGIVYAFSSSGWTRYNMIEGVRKYKKYKD